MKNQVIDILEDINPGVDHEARVDLVDSRCIDSLTMIAFVAELEDADRKSTRLNSSHSRASRMPSSA